MTMIKCSGVEFVQINVHVQFRQRLLLF